MPYTSEDPMDCLKGDDAACDRAVALMEAAARIGGKVSPRLYRLPSPTTKEDAMPCSDTREIKDDAPTEAPLVWTGEDYREVTETATLVMPIGASDSDEWNPVSEKCGWEPVSLGDSFVVGCCIALVLTFLVVFAVRTGTQAKTSSSVTVTVAEAGR